MLMKSIQAIWDNKGSVGTVSAYRFSPSLSHIAYTGTIEWISPTTYNCRVMLSAGYALAAHYISQTYTW